MGFREGGVWTLALTSEEDMVAGKCVFVKVIDDW